MEPQATSANIANLQDTNSPEARARRRREMQANKTASEKLKSSGTIVVAVGAGILTAIVKFIAAMITNSTAMFSEGIHSLVDSVNDSLLLIGNKKARRAPDAKHPFGYGTEVYFYSFTVSLVIFVLGGGLAIYEGVHDAMAGGTHIENPLINYIVLAIGIALEGYSLSVAVRTVNKARGDMKIHDFIRDSKSPANITVFLEDSAAVLGMGVALVGNIASTIFHNPIIDSAASIIIGCIMAAVALVLLKETRSLVIGEGLNVEEVNDIVFMAESDPTVVKCGRVLSLYLGPDDLLINLDVTFRDDLAEGDILLAIDRIEDEVMSNYPQASRIFIEPESLNEVYRQRRDRRLVFETYEEKKSQEDHREIVAQWRKHDEALIEKVGERRAKRRLAIAQAYNRTYFPELEAARAAKALEATEAAAKAELELKALSKKLFSAVPSMVGERVVLNRVVDTDADALRDLVENPRVQQYLPANLFEKQFDDAHQAIRMMYGDIFQNKQSLILAIRMKETGELAGLAEFYSLRDRLHKVSIGFRMRECFFDSDLATEAVNLMVGYLYGETDIEIITAHTMVEDEAASSVLEKADFIRTARYEEEDWGYPQPTLADTWFC